VPLKIHLRVKHVNNNTKPYTKMKDKLFQSKGGFLNDLNK